MLVRRLRQHKTLKGVSCDPEKRIEIDAVFNVAGHFMYMLKPTSAMMVHI